MDKCARCQAAPPRPRIGSRGPAPRYCDPCSREVRQEHTRGWNGRHKPRRATSCVICEQPVPKERSANAKTCSPECQRERIRRYHATYNEDNAGRRLAVERQRKYGLSPEAYQELFRDQGHECAICRTKTPPFVVDHDHDTGQVRGILCGNCNVMLGMAADSIAILNRAARYLEASRTPEKTNPEPLREKIGQGRGSAGRRG